MQHEHHRVPVTAVCFFFERILLSGEGHLVKAYDVHTKSLLAICPIFEGQAVHGITHSHSSFGPCFLVWGAQWLGRLHVHFDGSRLVRLEMGEVKNAGDWILDVAFCPNPASGRTAQAVVVTTHNSLLLALLDDSKLSLDDSKLSLKVLLPGSNSILYCAQASWLSPFKCLIASGTAFGDVMIWSCAFIQGQDGHSVETTIHYSFSAHQGSVFGLQFAPAHVAGAFGQGRHILASCSDDRTIRIWDISDLTVHAAPFDTEDYQTGFRVHVRDDASAPPLLCKAMGHLSRIWHVRFCKPETIAQACQLLTFGEDATIITWKVEPKLQESATLELNITQASLERAHSGKNLWAANVEDSGIIVAGGADGAITSRNLVDGDSMIEVAAAPCAITDMLDNYRAYGFVGRHTLVAMTDQGKICLLDFHEQQLANRSEPLGPFVSLRGYSIVATLDDIVVLGGSDGIVYSYKQNDTRLKELLGTGLKVAGLFAQHVVSSDDTPERTSALLVTSVGGRATRLLFFDSLRPEKGIHIQHEHKLDLAQGTVVTSFACVCIKGCYLAFIGSRKGTISIFGFRDSSESSSQFPCLNAHLGEAVTSLHAIAPRRDLTGDFMILSTGRDGTYATHLLSISDHKQVTLHTIHQINVAIGSNLEGIGQSPGGDILVWGFRSKEFVVFNVTAQQEIMSVQCGGAHRTFRFMPSDHGGTFVWTKASKLYLKEQTSLPFQALNSGGHGREIKAVATSPSNTRLIATGAEDTDIKISIYDETGFRCLHTLHKHNTGIQHLQWSSSSQFLFSSGGFEEFFIWRITPDVPHLQIGIICESKHPRSGTSDLRIMNFDVQEQEQEQEDNPSSSSTFHITMAYSDSTLRLWQYKDRSWSLLASGDYLTSCLTQCTYLAHESHSIITGSTNGHLTLWQPTTTATAEPRLPWPTHFQVHQNAILSLIVHDLAADAQPATHLILTGGDDNAIGITILSQSGKRGTILVRDAHAAAVTALLIVRHGHGRLWFVSAGLDQRVKLWRVDVDMDKTGMEGVDICLVQNSYTAVADVSDMDKIRTADDGDGVLICGVGMDVWRVPVDEM